jgi:hypothetical protein
MKLSGYHKAAGDEVTLVIDYDKLDGFDLIYMSKVFTDTPMPDATLKLHNVSYGGTGFFYDKAPFLPDAIERSMPDYHLYDVWVAQQIEAGKKPQEFLYYTNYSIGFLTRGCFRKCPFCVNQNYDQVLKHSPLDEFYDPARPKVCLLDDNFFGYPGWKQLLLELQKTGRPFQFKQGLDERLLTDEKCAALFGSRYDGDYIFAFDNVNDADLIKRNIRLARKYTGVVMKFYCFCGYDHKGKWDTSFWIQDVFDLFLRIEILMQNRCLPYVMRFARYTESPYRGVYISIARWCNQPSFYKKQSLREYAKLNGTDSACYKYISDFEESFPEVAYFYDMKFEKMDE